MRRFRVLMVTPWYPTPEAPWSYTFVRAHARAAATQHDVAVLHLRDVREQSRAPGLRFQADDETGVPVWEVEVAASDVPGVTFARRLAAAVLAARVVRERFGSARIIHAHMVEAAAPAIAASHAASRGPRAGRVLSEHYSGFALGTVTAGQIIKARTMFRRFDAVMPVSQELSRSLAGDGIGGRKVVVPNAYDPDLFYPSEDVSLGKGPVRLLAVGRLEAVKGFDVLLRALADLRTRADGGGWRLRIIGDGEQRSSLESLGRDLEIERAVTFCGALPPAAVAEEMRSSDLFVAPSRYETQGLAIVEAAGSGLPVLASEVGGIPEIVAHIDGRVVPPGDVASWSSALGDEIHRAAALDRDARRQQALRAQDRWSLSSVGATLDAVYRSVLHT